MVARVLPLGNLFESRQPGGGYFLQGVLDLPANCLFVDSNHAAKSDSVGAGRSPDAPLATLDYAVGLCTAGQGDTIVLMPGHTETKTATGDLATLDVAGIRVIGLGHGALQPTFVLTHAGATITISAANVLLRNVKVIADIADVAVGLTLGAGADGCTIEGCWFTSGALTKELKIAISVATTCTDVMIQRNLFETIDTDETGSETHAIFLAGSADRICIRDNEMMGNFGTAAIAGTVAASVHVRIQRNSINNTDSTNGLAISLHASTTGIVADNRLLGLKTNTVPLVAAGCANHENYTTAAVNESGLLKPTAETFS